MPLRFSSLCINAKSGNAFFVEQALPGNKRCSKAASLSSLGKGQVKSAFLKRVKISETVAGPILRHDDISR